MYKNYKMIVKSNLVKFNFWVYLEFFVVKNKYDWCSLIWNILGMLVIKVGGLVYRIGVGGGVVFFV